MEATDKQNPIRINDSDEIERLEEQKAELNSKDEALDLSIHGRRCSHTLGAIITDFDIVKYVDQALNLSIHGRRGSHTPGAIVADFDIVKHVDPALKTAFDAKEVENAVHCNGQPDFNLNQLESLRSEVQHAPSELLKNLNSPATIQKQQLPLCEKIDHFETADISTRMQLKNADGEVVIASNPTPPCDRDDQPNARKVQPHPSGTVQKVTFNGTLQGQNEVTSNGGEERARSVEVHNAPQSFTQFESLTKHLNINTGGEKPYTCMVCGKSFALSNYLTTHTRTHTGERPYTCMVCNKSFKDSSTLSKHYRIHTGKKPYTCKVCSQSFTQSNNLSQHLRIHTGEKPYTCKFCGKSFAVCTTLNTHIRTHTGEKPFKCNLCSKSFAQSGNLSQHLLIHTGERPYTCKVCSKSFARSNGLKRHLRIHTDSASRVEVMEVGVSPSKSTPPTTPISE